MQHARRLVRVTVVVIFWSTYRRTSTSWRVLSEAWIRVYYCVYLNIYMTVLLLLNWNRFAASWLRTYTYPVLEQLTKSYYFALGKGAKYCDERVCVYVCLSVRSHISKTTCPNFTKFSIHVTVTVARSSFDENAIYYVLPVLWMTSCFHITGASEWKPERPFQGTRTISYWLGGLP